MLAQAPKAKQAARRIGAEFGDLEEVSNINEGIALGEAVVGIESLTHDANELRCGKIKCFHCCGF